MQRPYSFRGQSGQAYVFTAQEAHGDWLRTPGIAFFAAPDGYGWRVIRMCSLRGREDDVQPLWALHDAERYGGDTVLLFEEADPVRRAHILADLEAGLSPLWPTQASEVVEAPALALAA
ncbi:MAG: hypothetical protein AAFO88_00780 [Pseudomonadota bacterium]